MIGALLAGVCGEGEWCMAHAAQSPDDGAARVLGGAVGRISQQMQATAVSCHADHYGFSGCVPDGGIQLSVADAAWLLSRA